MNSISDPGISRLLRGFRDCNPWWIVGIALLVRVIFVVAFALQSNWPNYSPLEGPNAPQAGVDGYVQIARTLLVSGEYAFTPGGEPVSFRPPLVPFLMAVFGAWSVESWYWVWLGYSVMAGTLVVWVLWRCAALTQMGPLATRMLLLATALHPYLIFSTRVPALPVTLTLLSTLVLHSIIRFIRSDGRRWPPLAFWWGLANLTHGSYLPLLVPFFVLLGFAIRGSWVVRTTRLGMTALGALLIVMPWTLRNHGTFDRWIPVATGSGLQYWLGDSIYFRGEKNIMSAFNRVARDFEQEQGRPLTFIHGGVLSLKDDQVLSAKAKQQMLSEPLTLIKRIAIGLPLFWVTMDAGWKKAVTVGLLNLPPLLLYLVVFIAALRKRVCDRIWITCQFYFLGFWSLFALVQAVGPYFVSILPCFLFLLIRGIGLLASTCPRNNAAAAT
jgi:hypothetical protein